MFGGGDDNICTLSVGSGVIGRVVLRSNSLVVRLTLNFRYWLLLSLGLPVILFGKNIALLVSCLGKVNEPVSAGVGRAKMS